MGNRNSGDEGVFGCIAVVLLGIIAMPVVGVYLMVTAKGDATKLVGGLVLTALGIILYGAMG